MKNLKNKNIKLSLVLLLFTMLALTPAANAAQISTDQEDYGPDEIVYITGTGFDIYSVINVTIVGPEEWGTDQFDSLSFPWWVYWSFTEPDRFDIGYLKTKCEGTFYVTATDGTNTATATFTDSKGLTITFAGTGSGSVRVQVDVPSKDEIIYGTTNYSGSNKFDNNANVTLTATADAGSTFVDWSGYVNSSSNSISFNLNNADRAVTVTFDLVSKITPTLSVTNSPVTYNGSPQAATVVGSMAGTVSDIKYDGFSTIPTDAGTYAVTADFAPTDTTNYNSLDDASAGNFVIQGIEPTLSVTNSPVTYNGSPQAATVVGSVAGTVSDIKYDGFSTIPTDAGTYAVTADFAPTDTTNYNSLDDASAGNFVIQKADAIIIVTPYDVTYDGYSHTATGTATGVLGEDLSSDLDLSGTTHTDAGDYTGDSWSFTDSTGNYNDDSGTVDDNIGKADAIIDVTPYDVTYDGDPHTATGTATGVLGEDLSAGFDFSSTTHTDAGFYAGDPWTFTDVTGNYNDDSGTVDDNIDKADAIIVVTPYDVTYDGNPHTATGTATGVKGEDLNPSGELDLSGTTHTNAGFYAGDPWIFTDSTGNYNDDSGTVDDNIDKATTSLVLTVNPQLLLVGGSFNMQATLSSDDSPTLDLSGMTITFTLDLDPGTGTDLGSENTNGSGVASKNVLTTSWEGNVYTITAVYAGDDNIVGSSDDATVVVAEPGAAATGGGFITDNGRTNFGFTVKMVEGTTNTYKGRFVIINKNKWRMKGTLDTYGTLDGKGYAGGSGTLYQWTYDGVLEISYWNEVASDVDIMLAFTDTYNGSGTGNSKKTVVLDTFGIQIDYSSEDFDASNPNTDPVSLKGGNIDIKSANNTTDGDPTTPPPTGKGKNK